jgi:hypothetical protein
LKQKPSTLSLKNWKQTNKRGFTGIPIA